MKESIDEVKALLADYCGIEAVALDGLNAGLASLPENAWTDFINYISCLLSLDTLELCPAGMAHDLSLLDNSEIFAQMLSEGNLYASYLLLSVIKIAISGDSTKKDDKYYQDILGRVGFIDASIQNSMNKLNSGMYLLVKNLVYLVNGVVLERYGRLPAARAALNRAKVGIEKFRLIECVDPLTLTLMYGVPYAAEEDIKKFCDAAVKQIEASVSIIDDGSSAKPEEKDGGVAAPAVIVWPPLRQKTKDDTVCEGAYPNPIRASGQSLGMLATYLDPRIEGDMSLIQEYAELPPPPAFLLRTFSPGAPDTVSVGYTSAANSPGAPDTLSVGYTSAAQSPEASGGLGVRSLGVSRTSAFSSIVRRPLFPAPAPAAAATSIEADVSTPRPGV